MRMRGGRASVRSVRDEISAVISCLDSTRPKIQHHPRKGGRVEEEEIDERTRLTRGTSTCDVHVGRRISKERMENE